MAEHSAETPRLPSSRAFRWGIKGFIIFSLVGVVLGWWWKRPTSGAGLESNLDWGVMVWLIPLVGLDYLLGGFRYRLFFDGEVLPKISLWDCMRSNWANIFMGVVTPFQTGGGPAQCYILWRSGAKVSESVLISLVTFSATLFFFLGSVLGALYFLPAELFGENFNLALRTGFGAIGGVTILVLLILFFPQTALLAARQLFKFLPMGTPKFLRFRDNFLAIFQQKISYFGETFQKVLRKKKLSLALVFLATLVLFFNKYFMGYVITQGLGQKVPFGIFLGIQCVQLFLIYFAPTPGASGVAELSTVWLMQAIMPASVLLVFAVTWRMATTILGAIIGGFVLFFDLRRQPSQSSKTNTSP